jgi:predicted transcriptional regulator
MKERLDTLAEATHRSKSYLAGEALRQYIDLEGWQIGEIQQALQEADSNDFASDRDVDAVIKKYAG